MSYFNEEWFVRVGSLILFAGAGIVLAHSHPKSVSVGAGWTDIFAGSIMIVIGVCLAIGQEMERNDRRSR